MPKRFTFFFALRLAAVFCLVSALMADAKSVAGEWLITAITQDGDEIPYVLKIAAADGALTGTVRGEGDEYKLEEIKLEGDVLTFSVTMTDNAHYLVQVTVTGDAMDGTWKSSDSDGKLKGKRRPA